MLVYTGHPVRSIVFGYRADAFAANALDEFLNQSSPKEKLGGTTPKQAEVDFSSNLAVLTEKSKESTFKLRLKNGRLTGILQGRDLNSELKG